MANEVRLIDANALSKRFDERQKDDIELYGVHIAECFPADEAKEIVDQIPTIDPESLRPKGRWVSDEGDILFHCSECGTQISTSWDYDDLSWNYCPNCGKKMEG